MHLLSTLNPARAARDAFASTDHGALMDGIGDTSHLASDISHLRLIRSDGTDALVPANLRGARELELLQPGQLHAAHEVQPAWYSAPPARRSHRAFSSLPAPAPASPPTVTAPMAQRRRRADFRNAWAENEPEPDRIPTWLLGVAAIVFVAAIVVSSLVPWGFALPL